MRVLKMFRLLIILGVAFFVPLVMAQDYPQRRFPVVINVEGEYIATSMWLKMPIKSYLDSVSIFASNTHSFEEKTFVDFTNAIRSNDLKTIDVLLYQPPPPKEQDVRNKTGGVLIPSKSPDQFLQMYRQIFNEFKELSVVGQIPVEGGSLFLWYANTIKGSILRGFIVLNVDGKLRVSEVSMMRPVEVFIVNTLGRLKEGDLVKFINNQAVLKEKHYSFPLNSSDVSLEFRGRYADIDIHNKSKKVDAIVSAVQKSTIALQDKKLDDFYSFYTKKSADKLKQWFASMNLEGFDAYIKDQSKPKYIKFIIDGGSLSILFLAPKESGNWQILPIYYKYLVKEGDNYKIANIFFEGFMDDILNNSQSLKMLVYKNNEQPKDEGRKSKKVKRTIE